MKEVKYVLNYIRELFRDKLLFANFVSNLFFSIAYPVIHFLLIKDVGDKIIALNSIILCIGGMVFPVIWNKYSDKLYKKYGLLLGIEIITYTTLMLLILTGTITNKAYYLLDTFIFAIISKNIICGGNKLRSKRYNSPEKRERYDNSSNVVTNMSCLIGFGISFIVTIPINIAFVLITIGICFDNIFYYQVWRENSY